MVLYRGCRGVCRVFHGVLGLTEPEEKVNLWPKTQKQCQANPLSCIVWGSR